MEMGCYIVDFLWYFAYNKKQTGSFIAGLIILDMINAIGEEELQWILSDFSCPVR